MVGGAVLNFHDVEYVNEPIGYSILYLFSTILLLLLLSQFFIAHPCLVVGHGSRLQAQRRRRGADATRLLLEARLRHAHQEKWALTAETRPPTGPLS